ncbi:MAG: hypothetical protein HFE63_09770 [Clostridiales bacterium]|nr:hypothetical protein [Clostridiales bacterium]
MDNNEKLLQEVYRNVKMGGDSIVNLLDKVDDKKLRGEMTVELDAYRRFSNEAGQKLNERGLKPQELSPVAKTSAKVGMAFNTMLDTTTSHIAEMMINGATMGIIDLEKQLNEGGHSPEAKAFADDVLEFEKNTVERLGTFL